MMSETADHIGAESESVARFITGMSRAGTTWMGKCLNSRPDVAVFGETSFWGRWYVPPRDDGTYDQAQIDGILERLKRRGTCVQSLSGDGPGCLRVLNRENVGGHLDEAFAGFRAPQTPLALFQRLGAMVARAEGAAIAIEKTPHHVNWIGRIIREIPSARFLILMRDPYDFMVSYQHQGARKSGAERWKYRWKNHPMGTALVWKGYLRFIDRATREWPDRTLVVRFEDLGADAAGVLERVQRFFGLEPQSGLASAVPPDNTSFPAGVRPRLRGEEGFWLNLVARRQIRASGYDTRPTPVEPLRILGSILLVPLWLVRQYVHLRRRTGGSMFAYIWHWIRPARPKRSSQDS